MATLFFSYSHKDEKLRDELEKHLSILKRQGVLDVWHDRRIDVGSNINNEINIHLRNADVILLLVSSDFLASDYCYEKEMKFAIERHNKKEAVVIPVILRPCLWYDAPFGGLLATPTDGKAVTKFPTLDDGFLDVANSIKDKISNLTSKKPVKTNTIKDIITSSQLPRSSNLRVPVTVTDQEKDEFLDNAFEYIARFFEGSLKELEERNKSHYSTKFKRIDSQRFSAHIYLHGEKKAECLIFYGNSNFSNGISYSHNVNNSSNSLNESLSVEHDGYTLSLKPIGISMIGMRGGRQGNLTLEGAAEYYWSMLIEPLQRNSY